MMSNNMRERFVCSNFDEVDVVLDTDKRFEEAIAAADEGEYDLLDVIVRDLEESGTIKISNFNEESIEYNEKQDDAIGLLDSTAEDIRSYVSEADYDDEDGDLIDSVMGDVDSIEDYEDYE